MRLKLVISWNCYSINFALFGMWELNKGITTINYNAFRAPHRNCKEAVRRILTTKFPITTAFIVEEAIGAEDYREEEKLSDGNWYGIDILNKCDLFNGKLGS